MTGELHIARQEITGWAHTLEERVERKSRELEQAHHSLLHTEKLASVGKLAATVAHEINNPLFGILTNARLAKRQLEKTAVDPAQKDKIFTKLGTIEHESQRCGEIVKNLLAFSRQQTLRPQVLQLPDVVSEVSHLLKRLLGETVQLVVKHGRDLFPVRADPGQLEQVIVNLSVNARDAMAGKGGGTLTIQTYSVKAAQVAELGSDILPTADYWDLADRTFAVNTFHWGLLARDGGLPERPDIRPQCTVRHLRYPFALSLVPETFFSLYAAGMK